MSTSPSSEPLEEDRVVLRCKADKHIYGNLAWFHVTNVSEVEQLTSVQPCHSLTLQRMPQSQGVLPFLEGTNVTLDLLLPNASRQDEGLYACQVENVKTQERTCLLRRLSLKSERILQIYGLKFCDVLDNHKTIFYVSNLLSGSRPYLITSECPK